MLPNIKTTRANKDIIDAANAWCKDSAAAEVKYGHISKRDTSPCDDKSDDISAWNVSSVTSIKGMLLGCETFNGDLSRWDVSNVNNMQFTFRGCSHILDKHNPKGDPV